jgi:hypothetical protein
MSTTRPTETIRSDDDDNGRKAILLVEIARCAAP